MAGAGRELLEQVGTFVDVCLQVPLRPLRTRACRAEAGCAGRRATWRR